MVIINLAQWLQKNNTLQEFNKNRANIATRNKWSETAFQQALEGTDELDLIADALSSSIIWSNTPEGREYWAVFHRKWERHIYRTYHPVQGPYKIIMRPIKLKLKATNATS